ncbi:MAG: AmmeMemoRadiSam system protein B [Desulfurococcaceae archaeon]
MKRLRRPVVAGYFYPRDKEDLVEMIEWSFKHRLGPGKTPSLNKTRKHNILGFIVPHAGYTYSGPIAAHSYYEAASEGVPETVVILGTNHTGYGKPVSIYPEGVWETPLGLLEVDSELGEKIAELSEIADIDEYAHLEEHSVEVQLPFIQYIYGDKVKILPIVIGVHTPELASDVSAAIANAVRSLNRDVIIISSSDFTHYEPYETALEKDSAAINRILELDTNGFYRVVIDENVTICGPGGIMTIMEIAKSAGAKAALLKHATSGDIGGDKSSVVGYATIKYYK